MVGRLKRQRQRTELEPCCGHIRRQTVGESCMQSWDRVKKHKILVNVCSQGVQKACPEPPQGHHATWNSWETMRTQAGVTCAPCNCKHPDQTTWILGYHFPIPKGRLLRRQSQALYKGEEREDKKHCYKLKSWSLDQGKRFPRKVVKSPPLALWTWLQHLTNAEVVLQTSQGTF